MQCALRARDMNDNRRNSTSRHDYRSVYIIHLVYIPYWVASVRDYRLPESVFNITEIAKSVRGRAYTLVIIYESMAGIISSTSLRIVLLPSASLLATISSRPTTPFARARAIAADLRIYLKTRRG